MPTMAEQLAELRESIVAEMKGFLGTMDRAEAPPEETPQEYTQIEDEEVLAIAIIIDVIDKLDEGASSRVLNYLLDRYNLV